MIAELDLEVSAKTVALRYADLLARYVIDNVDAAIAASLPVATVSANTLMFRSFIAKQLARTTLAFADTVNCGGFIYAMA